MHLKGLSIVFGLCGSCNSGRFFSRGLNSFTSTTMTGTATRRTTRLGARKASSSTPSTSKRARTNRKKVALPEANVMEHSSKRPSKDLPATDANQASEPWFHVYTKGDEEYNRYMATEWGFEKRGTVPLFEKISLEGAQSGLSWLTILRKREAYRRVFHNFDIGKVAAMTQGDVERILAEEDKTDPRNIVVRHRGKIESVINNAQCIQKLLQENTEKPDYFDEFLWSFVDDRPILNMKWDGKSLNHLDTQTKESQAMSKALKSRGFRFVGPTTMYALMQSCGMVIDHPVNSPEWHAARQRVKKRPGGYKEQEP